MNIAALLGTSGILPDKLGKVIAADVDPSEFKQLLQNMTTGEVAQDAAVSISNLDADAVASPGLDLLSTLFKLFDEGCGQTSTLDPTGEASDADQDETKASLTELMAVLQPLVGQSEVTLAAGDVALQVPQPVLPASNTATTTTSTALPSHPVTAVNAAAGNGNMPADVYATTNSTTTTTSQPLPASTSTTSPQPPTLTDALAQQTAATSTATATTSSNSTLPTTENTSISNPGSPINTIAAAAAQTEAQPATSARAEGATNALNSPDTPASATSTPHSTAQSVNGAPARVANADFARLLNNEATVQSGAANGGSAPAVAPSAMANSTATGQMAAGQTPAADNGQQPAFAVSSRQAQPDQQAADGSGATVTPATNVTASVTQAGPAASPEMPKLPVLQQVTDSVKLMVQQGETEVRMQLHPKSLGEVHIQLHMAQDGTLAVRMLTETGQAQRLLHEQLPQLKAAFSAQGMQVSQMNVDVGSDSSAFYNQARNSGQNPFAGAQYTPHNRGYADDSTPTPVAVQNQLKLGSLNAIDFHA